MMKAEKCYTHRFSFSVPTSSSSFILLPSAFCLLFPRVAVVGRGRLRALQGAALAPGAKAGNAVGGAFVAFDVAAGFAAVVDPAGGAAGVVAVVGQADGVGDAQRVVRGVLGVGRARFGRRVRVVLVEERAPPPGHLHQEGGVAGLPAVAAAA